ncbi:hypothetical protein [Variovorax saccharolyticus]|uniref:hypothetical protein n=1 Tax=Variovorax saccharolyticus TaxID=3053516 RepID=UPI002575A0E0|nr:MULTISPECIES: hypothetical protein [unclassified Variovorax]MDM0020502.1 hypothetical protein [Variovorax sp. J22R187]MDM0025958.1 hypothetical protein [Variovorax sp. J31P216]
MKIETLTPDGKAIEGAECRLSNDKGDALTQSGQSVLVRRSGANLRVECTQAGLPPASGQAVSRVNAGMVGNIVVGGVIGAAIDVGSGAGYNYPSWMQLVFGEERSYDRSVQQGDLPVAGVAQGVTRMAAPAPVAGASAPAKVAVVEAAVPASAAPPPAPVIAAIATSADPAPAAAPKPASRVSLDDLGALLPARK